MGGINRQKIPPVVQAEKLRILIPNSKVTLKAQGTGVVWEGDIRPNPISLTYRISIAYSLDKRPVIRVLSPKLVFPEGHKLPHVYSHQNQEICLYYPPAKEWHDGMLFTKTILPWASEWLYHYEIWAATGEWHGGGIEHRDEKKKEKFSSSILRSLK